MGKELVRGLVEAGHELAGGAESASSPFIGKDAGEVAGIAPLGRKITSSIEEAVKEADSVIDFTLPETSLAVAGIAARLGKAHVIGTTGFTESQLAELKKLAEKTVIVWSPNMSLGVNLLAALTQKVAGILGADFDIEILEMHHRLKKDAPSGTALLLGEAAAKGRGVKLADEAVRARDGITGERKPGSIGFATLRGGDVVGDHTVMFAGEGERIELTHKAADRKIFASGAIFIAARAAAKKPGFYGFRDFVEI